MSTSFSPSPERFSTLNRALRRLFCDQLLRSVFTILMLIACVGILATSTLCAQTTTGAVSGTVTDGGGASIVGAQVTVTNVETRETHSAVSNKSGNYIFPLLAPGRYELTSKADGFSTEKQTGVTVNVNENAHVSFTLAAGAVDQSITINASTAGIDATETQLGQTIDQEQIHDLPLNGRSAYGLVLLSPGVSNYTGTVATGSYNGVYFSTNGMRINENSFFLDGAYNTAFFRDTGNLLPNPDALSEFRVLTSNFDAEYGRLPGAVVNVITKSGTNAFHGLIYDYLRNDALNARQEFVTGAATPMKQNQFGANFGGPIRRDKIFGFFSYEGLQIHTPTVITSTSIITPTAAEAIGDFSALAASKYPKNPATGAVYSCNGKAGVICQNLLDPVAVGILKTVPLADPITGHPLQQTSNANSSANEGLARIDAQLTQSHKLSATAFISRGFLRSPTGGGNEILSYSGLNQTNGLANFILDDNWIISPSKINDINLSFTLNHSIIGNIYDNNYLASLGSQIHEGGPLQTQPYVSITGYFIAGSGSSSQDDKTQQSLAAYDNFLWTRGNHQIKVGGSFVWNRYADTGVYDGSTASTFTGAVTGNALADFLVGNAATFRQNSGTYYRLHQGQPALYVQDSWRVTHRLTLNGGLRWEIFSPLVGANTYGTFVPYAQSQKFPTAPIGLVFSGDHGIPNGIFPTQWRDLSPRVGFAYDVYGQGKTILRGGFGIYYVGFEGGDTENLQQQPYALDLTLSKTPSLANPYGTGVDPFPYIVSTTNPVFQSGASIAALPPGGNISTPYVEEYNLNIEQQLSRNWQAQIAYVGSASRKQYIVRDENAPVYSPGASTTTAGLNARRPYQPTPAIYTYAGIFELAPIGSGSYNALQLTLSHHFDHNFSVLANYTWEKIIDVVASDPSSISATQLVDDSNPARDRGISVLNLPHIFAASASYAVPHFRHFGFAGRNILGGWQLNTIVQLHSGAPISILSGVDSNLNGTNNDRPNLLGNPYLSTSRSRAEKVAQYFNQAAFAQVPTNTPYGNVARNSLVGPGYANTDFSAFKDISIWHQHALQIRGEFFNLFNHVNLNNPTATVTSASFGKISTAGSPRIVQIAARYSF